MNFALVTEGISEYKIIKHLLLKYFKDGDEPDINQMQPKLTDNEKKQGDGSIGGWVEVLNYCTLEKELQSIFVENDYLVIQIDTDMCGVSPYDVSLENKTSEELHAAIIERLLRDMPQDVKDNYGEKIIFAICIDTIECWLLPIYYTDVHRCKTNNCLSHLNQALKRKNIHPISTTGDKNNHNSKATYVEILKNIKKKKEIETHSQHNHGFSKFVEQLANI